MINQPINPRPTAVSAAFMRVLEAHPLNALRVGQGLAPANVLLMRGPGARFQSGKILAELCTSRCISSPP